MEGDDPDGLTVDDLVLIDAAVAEVFNREPTPGLREWLESTVTFIDADGGND